MTRNPIALVVLRDVLVLGALGMAGSYATDARRFWANWIVWFLFLLTVALGSLFLVALEPLVGARWSVPLRRVPERLATLLIPAVPAALIALGGLPSLYPAVPQAGKALWLARPWFALRTGLCLALCLLALAVLVRSLDPDRGRPRSRGRAARFAPAAMAVIALTTAVVAFDWVMGLTPDWYSDILGAYVFAGSFLAGLAATILGVLVLLGQGRLPGAGPAQLGNLGGLTFAFTVFWAYLAFSQYLLIWYGNLPEEVVWYRQRLQGGWRGFTLALAAAHFLIPFAALLARKAKGEPGRLRWVALLMLGAHLMDLQWLVLPALGQGLRLGWPELCFAAFFLGLGLLWLRKACGEDLPMGDPLLPQGLRSP